MIRIATPGAQGEVGSIDGDSSGRLHLCLYGHDYLYIYNPRRDITPFEVARAGELLLFLSVNFALGEPLHVIDVLYNQMPPEVQRHFVRKNSADVNVTEIQ